MKDFRQALLATFQVEHQEHVQRIRESLRAFEQSTGDAAGAEFDDVFRRAHSLKGAARAVDLRPIEQLAHQLETLFSRIRGGQSRLDRPAVKVIDQVLDASEDWLASTLGGKQPTSTEPALAAIDALVGDPAGESGTGAPGQAVLAERPAETAPAQPVVKPPKEEEAPVVAQSDTVRLNADSLDRIVRSAGQLLTESVRQNNMTQTLRQVNRDVADIASERSRVRKHAARAFRQLEASPEFAAVARYVNYLDHQIHLLSKQVGAAVRSQSQNAWALRNVAAGLQRDVRQARMVPIESVFAGFRRMVREVARDERKEVELHVKGWQVEADRVVLQALKDPVMHMLRNAISHGIEHPAERAGAGKDAEGRIDLVIEARGNQFSLTVEDDGRGLDVARITEIAVRKGLINSAEAKSRAPEELMRLVLLPGFSTSRSVTELSGRGMGLSVLAEVATRLQGKIDIAPGRRAGTRISITVPLSVSSHRLLLVSCHDQTFALPLHGIERLHRVQIRDVQSVESSPVIKLDGQQLPVVSLGHLLGTSGANVTARHNTLCVMVMRSGTRRLAVVVDAFLSERNAIIKDLPAPANGNSKISGGVLLEDGSVCLALNPAELVEAFRVASGSCVVAASVDTAAGPQAPLQILVVDDSLTTRTLEKSLLEAHGYQVAVAVDGIEALNHLRATPVGLVISDLEMPRLDGLGLLEEMKRDPRLSKVPVIMVSSVDNPEVQARGMALGADAYIVKQRFEQRELLETIRQIL